MLLTRTSLASIIIKSIAETFLGKSDTDPGYIMRQRSASGRCQLYHAIYEYSNGQRKAIKFEGDDMEGKLYISQLSYGYWVLISIFNIMIAVYQNLSSYTD